MEWFKIEVRNKFLSEVNFENKKSASAFIKIIRSEYLKRRYRAFLYIITIFIFYIIYLLLSYQFKIINIDRRYSLGSQQFNLLNRIITWSFFCITIYFIFYFFKLGYQKSSPTLANFIKNEVNNLGFKIQRGYKTGIYFFIFNSISIIFFILIETGVIYSYNYVLNILIFNLILLYIFSSLMFPIIWGVLHDAFYVKLKKKYSIQFHFQYNIKKSEEYEFQTMGIYMTSNRLCSKLNKERIKLYNEISETRWLPRKGKFTALFFGNNPFLYFHEYSTPLNFQKQFLNIVLALREWDILTHD